jgi:hypothetical protein
MNKKYIAFGLILIITCAFFGACEIPLLSRTPMFTDRPQMNDEEKVEPVNLVAGPYITNLSQTEATVCFVTDKKVSAGIHINRHGTNQTQRGGKPTYYHSIKIGGLRAGKTYRAEVLMKDGPQIFFPVSTFPENFKPLDIAFVVGGAKDPKQLKENMNLLSKYKLDSILLCRNQVRKPQSKNSWINEFIRPYIDYTSGVSFFRAPDVKNVPEEIFPEQKDESYSINMGALFVVFVAPEDLKKERDFRFSPWLKKELAGSEAAWKVVVFPDAPLVSGINGVNKYMLEKFGPIMEENGVSLCISSNPGFYHRSVNVGTEQNGVYYLSLCNTPPAKTPNRKANYTATQSDDPGVLILQIRNNILSGYALKTSGARTDSFNIKSRYERRSFVDIDRARLITSAWALEAQKKEMQAIARQVFKAVQNPAHPEELPIIINNPSSMPFKGTIEWKSDESVFFVTPEKIRFSLQPGEGVRSVFKLRSNKPDGSMPVVKAISSSGFEIEEKMLLTWGRQLDVPFTNEKIVVDGESDEEFWKDAVHIAGFFSFNGEKLDHDTLDVWMIAGEDGLRFRFRCNLPKDFNRKTTAKEHDSNVWQDESVEIYIDPRGAGREYYQFALSIADVALDSNYMYGKRWNPEWEHKVIRKNKNYNIEVLIPYQALDIISAPEQGQKWGVNITRNNYSSGKCKVEQATPTYGPNSRSGCYIKAEF